MSDRLTDEQIKELGMEYLKLDADHNHASSMVKQYNQVAKASWDRMCTISSQLKKTVQPICGSATMPHVRVFYSGDVRCLVIAYDRNVDGGRISVEKFENYKT